MLQSMGLQRVGQGLVTEQHQQHGKKRNKIREKFTKEVILKPNSEGLEELSLSRKQGEGFYTKQTAQTKREAL